jgi:hypothetical protein
MKSYQFALALLVTSALLLSAQTSPRKPFQPAEQQAPGAAPNKVWLNSSSKVYHCPGDRYYGRTKAGKYVTEPEAKAGGAHGPRGETCFK